MKTNALSRAVLILIATQQPWHTICPDGVILEVVGSWNAGDYAKASPKL